MEISTLLGRLRYLFSRKPMNQLYRIKPLVWLEDEKGEPYTECHTWKLMKLTTTWVIIQDQSFQEYSSKEEAKQGAEELHQKQLERHLEPFYSGDVGAVRIHPSDEPGPITVRPWPAPLPNLYDLGDVGRIPVPVNNMADQDVSSSGVFIHGPRMERGITTDEVRYNTRRPVGEELVRGGHTKVFPLRNGVNIPGAEFLATYVNAYNIENIAETTRLKDQAGCLCEAGSKEWAPQYCLAALCPGLCSRPSRSCLSHPSTMTRLGFILEDPTTATPILQVDRPLLTIVGPGVSATPRLSPEMSLTDMTFLSQAIDFNRYTH
jgi:hypothetical protein